MYKLDLTDNKWSCNIYTLLATLSGLAGGFINSHY